MRQLTPRQLMVPAVVGLTLLHLGLRLIANDREPLLVSPLEGGDRLEASTLPAGEAAALVPETCLQIIVFSPECPFCQQAASREAKNLTEASREKRLWYTDTETALLPYFI